MIELVDDVLGEATDEATGASSKRWAVVVLVVLAGAAAAAWLLRRSHHSTTGYALDAGDQTSAKADPI
jgi:hypothetical protein